MSRPQAYSKCYNLTSNGYSDWRLPTKTELYAISKNYYKINTGLENSGVYAKKLIYDKYYWASDIESGKYQSVRMYPTENWYSEYSNNRYVRAVREFTFR